MSIAARAIRTFAVSATLLASTFGTAHAQVTFSNLSGNNGDAYTGSTENGFAVSVTQGSFFEGHNYGYPVPDIYGGPVFTPGTGTISLTRTGGGLFTFASIDFSSNSAQGTQYSIQGFVRGVSTFTMAGSINTMNAFTTFTSTAPSQLFDNLRVTLTPAAGVTSYNIDNIMVSPSATTTPEPSTLALIGSGFAGLLPLARRKRQG